VLEEVELDEVLLALVEVATAVVVVGTPFVVVTGGGEDAPDPDAGQTGGPGWV